MTEHHRTSAGTEVQLPLSTDMVLTAAKEVRTHLDKIDKPYSAGIVGDCIVEIERLRGQVKLSDNLLSGLTAVVEGLKAELAERSDGAAQAGKVPVAYLHRARDVEAEPSLSFEPARNHHQWTSEPLYAAEPPAATVETDNRLVMKAFDKLQRDARSSAATEPVVWRVRYCGKRMYFEEKSHAEIYAQGDDNTEPLYRAVPQEVKEPDARSISDAYSDWAWEKEGTPVGLMLPNESARAGFFAGAKWASRPHGTTPSASDASAPDRSRS